MKYRDFGLIVGLSLFVIFIVVGMASHYLLEDDNPIEESAEELLKKKTGIEIDFTPSTPETTKPSQFPEDYILPTFENSSKIHLDFWKLAF